MKSALRWIEKGPNIPTDRLSVAYLEMLRDVKRNGGTISLDFVVRGMDLSITCRKVGGRLMVKLQRWYSQTEVLDEWCHVIWSGDAPTNIEVLEELTQDLIKIQDIKDVLES